MRWNSIVAVVVLCGCLLSGTPVSAQLVTGDILGTVTDSTGVIPGARVSIKNLGTGVVRTGEASERGEFTFTLLPPGQYAVTVDMAGFKTFEWSPVNLAVGDRARINARLTVGEVSEKVEVTGASTVLQTDVSTLQSVVPERAVQQLPLNGRNFVQLAQIAPGSNEGSSRSAASGGGGASYRPSSALVVNGQSDVLNNFMIDGLDNNERIYGLLGVRPSIDAIAEVNVMTGQYTAEIGRTSGGVVNVITKSGMDLVHGSAFEFLRDDRFDAKDYFATTKPEFTQNQFGGSLGGPIKRGKTFFFGDYEGFRKKKGQPRLVSVPTVEERASAVANAASLSPIALKYFALYPAPNLPGKANNYSTAPVQVQNADTFDLRIDHHVNDTNSLFARYTYNNTRTTTPGPLPLVNGIDPAQGVYAPELVQNAHVNYLHIFNNRLLIELKAGYTRISLDTKLANGGKNLGSDFGITGANYDDYTTGLPFVTITGLQSLGDATFNPQTTYDSTTQLMGALSYTVGNHSLKFGAAVIRSAATQFQNRWGLGQYIFNSLGDFLNDRVFKASRANLMQPQTLRTWEPNVYAQDNWRVTPRLTLNVGLRYSVFTPYTGGVGDVSNFDPDTATVLVPGTNGVGATAGVKTDWLDLAPRVGLAYTPRDGTVIRGGFAISYFPDTTGGGINYKNQPIEIAWEPAPGTPGTNMANGLPIPVVTAGATDQKNLSGSLSGIDRNFKNSYSEQFSVNIQHQIRQFVASIGYVGVLTRRQGMNLQINQAEPAPCPPGPACYVQKFPYYSVLPNVTGGIRYQVSEGVSDYHALQTSIERRYGRGLTVGANYTWAHGLSDVKSYTGRNLAQGWGFVPKNLGWDKVADQVHQLDYGNSDFDVRHRVAIQGSYELPFGRSMSGVRGALVGGWRLSGIYVWQTGLPFTVVNQTAVSNTGAGRDSDRPNMVRSPVLSNPTVAQWFDTTAFVKQEAGTLGTEARNALYGPHYRHLDLSIVKGFAMGSSRNLECRIEAFNVTNTANFDFPDATLGSRSFGMISRTRGTPRELQFALKFTF